MEGRVGEEGEKYFGMRLRRLDYSAANRHGLHSAEINLQTVAEAFVVVLNQRIRKHERILGIIQSLNFLNRMSDSESLHLFLPPISCFIKEKLLPDSAKCLCSKR